MMLPAQYSCAYALHAVLLFVNDLVPVISSCMVFSSYDMSYRSFLHYE